MGGAPVPAGAVSRADRLELNPRRSALRSDIRNSALPAPQPEHFFVALPSHRDLSLCAKDLFVAAMDAKRPQPFDGPGQVKQSGIGGYSALPALHQLRRDCRAERFLIALTGELGLVYLRIFWTTEAALRSARLSSRETEHVQVFIQRPSLGLDQGNQQHLISTTFGARSYGRSI